MAENRHIQNIHLLKNIIENEYYGGGYFQDNFCAFKSINNILFIIYSKSKLIISYNLVKNKKVSEIKTEANIHMIKHYYNKVNKIDLILSLGGIIRELFNFRNWNLLAKINVVIQSGFLASGCLLFDNNEINIISAHHEYGLCDPMKVFNIKGSQIKEINYSGINTYCVDTYEENSNIYIITANSMRAKSYDFNKNEVYRVYWDNEYANKNSYTGNEHNGFDIINDENILKLIDSSCNGIIRIQNFHSGELLRKIELNITPNCICLWNNDYLLLGCNEGEIKIVDLKNGSIIKELNEGGFISTIKKIIHPYYGECILSLNSSNIKIYGI